LRVGLFVIIAGFFLYEGYAYGGRLGIGLHAGYGVIEYSEKKLQDGGHVTSESLQPLIITGISTEYTINKDNNIFINLTVDWMKGLKSKEGWREDGLKTQEDDIDTFGQFYDLRFGYKDTIEDIYYRFYISGGWDGLSIIRDDFMTKGVHYDDAIKEDFSLVRGGVGGGIGFKAGRWALDGRLAYAYYPYAMIKEDGLSSHGRGTCLDSGIGIAYQIEDRLSLYTGFSYTLIELNEDDAVEGAVFSESTMEIINGIVNLTYSF